MQGPFHRLLALLPLFTAAIAFSPAALHAQSDAYSSSALADSGKILVIVRENTKPGKDGAAHEKTEAQFAHAMAAAKINDYYEGLVSLSGPPRALFISDYSSLAEMEAKRKTVTPALDAALDSINEADGGSVAETSIGYFLRRDDLSTNVKAAPSGARYMEIERYEVKPGHEPEFEEGAKLFLRDMVKSVPAAHWTCYSSIYGHTQGAVYLFLTSLKSLSEADAELASQKDFEKGAGPGDLKKLTEALESSTISAEFNLFRVNPKLSYPSPADIASDPAFWKPKPADAKSALKPAPKPQQ